MLKNRVNSQSDTPITEHELRVLCNNIEYISNSIYKGEIVLISDTLIIKI